MSSAAPAARTNPALDSSHHHLPHATHRLGPAKALLDELSLSLRYRVAFTLRMASGTAELLPDLFWATWGMTGLTHLLQPAYPKCGMYDLTVRPRVVTNYFERMTRR